MAIKIALLSTGDELTLGSILNSNAQEIAQILFSEGFQPDWQMTVADDVEDIKAALIVLSQEHDIIITIGGLGPTSDDKTRFALASFLEEPLVEHEPSALKLKKRYQEINLPYTELSHQQTLFPQNADILNNLTGSANGCACRMKQSPSKMVFMLPGPPRECLPMFQQEVLPKLLPLLTTKKTLLQWKVFGVAEGVIAEKVDNALRDYTDVCRTSFRWDYPYVDCKVLFDENETLKEKIFAILNPVLSPYQLDPNNQRATERLKNINIKTPIYIQDQATGGMLESRIHTPDSHCKIIFKPAPDESDFFYIEGLDNYWNNKEDEKESILTIKSRHGVKTLTIPFRKALLEVYATEFIANQIFLLINQDNQ